MNLVKTCFAVSFLLCLTPVFLNLGHANGEGATRAETVKKTNVGAPQRFSTTIEKLDLKLALKRYENKGQTPVILVPGFASNDRLFDSTVEGYSFAKYLAARNFDVWIVNFRSAGTDGFRSECPDGPHGWTVEELSAYDMPALIEKVIEETGEKPIIVAHSLAASILDGYLMGLVPAESRDFERRMGRERLTTKVSIDRDLGEMRRRMVRGAISISGAYNLWWPKSIKNFKDDPIRSENDFYQSDYELELLSRSDAISYLTEKMPAFPMNWLPKLISLPLDQVPFIGDALADVYGKLKLKLVKSPLFSLFYYEKNTHPDLVFAHGQDGIEEIPPRLTAQMMDAIREGGIGIRTGLKFIPFEMVRSKYDFPYFVFAGGKDRLANVQMVEKDGFLKIGSANKLFRRYDAGHLDVISGEGRLKDLWLPAADWIQSLPKYFN